MGWKGVLEFAFVFTRQATQCRVASKPEAGSRVPTAVLHLNSGLTSCLQLGFDFPSNRRVLCL